MPQPTAYEPDYNFTQFQASHPSDPLPAANVDNEFFNVAIFSAQVCANLALIQRDDGELANQVVTPESLSQDTLNMIGGFVPRGAWVTATSYAVGDMVTESGTTYVCAVVHTSGTFATDLSAGKWIAIATTGSSSAAFFQPTGSTAPDNGMYLPAANTVGIAARTGFDVLRLTAAATSINFFLMTASATGNPVSLAANGVDTNISVNWLSKGTGGHNFYTGGGLQFQVVNAASAVNYLSASGAAAAAAPFLAALGSDTNIDLTLVPKGTGKVNAPSVNVTGTDIPAIGIYAPAANTLGLSARTLPALLLSNPASAVNYLAVSGSITAVAPIITSEGSDTNIGIRFSAKGAAGNAFFGDSGSTQLFRINYVASAVNYIVAQPSATGSPVYFAPAGSDTNVAIGLTSKGNGAINFYTNNTAQLQFQITHTVSAVNFLDITGGATTGPVTIRANGSDTDVSIQYVAKGAASHTFYSSGGTAPQFQVGHVASSVNYFQAAGAAAGAGPAFNAVGADTNIDLLFVPKGTGVLRFGTHTGTGDTATNGYITIKDAAGNSRRLATVA